MPKMEIGKTARVTLSIAILALTIGLFMYYAVSQPNKVIDPIIELSFPIILVVIAGYFGVTYTNSVILRQSLKILHTPYAKSKAFLLTAYSSIVNFFGPLQSGPGFRALYLKQQLGVRIRDYSLTLIVYYLFYGIINIAVIGLYVLSQISLLSGLSLLVVGTLLAIGLYYALRKKLAASRTQKLVRLLVSRHAAIIFAFTLLQCIFTLVIYFVELLAVDESVSLFQAILYTAVANLTLFVALTPGAIGIRESFLLFSQQMHGISQETVIAASIIDRALYFVVLGLLFVFSLSMHAHKRLKISKKAGTESQDTPLQ